MLFILKLIQFTVVVLQTLSPKLAAKFCVFMASKPRRYPIRAREQAQLDSGEKISYTGAHGTQNTAWVWGGGPVVLVCHGWESRAGQMATLAIAIADAGFKAVAIDFTAHGFSGGSRVSFKDMSEEVLNLSKQLQEQYGEIYAMVGHSAGGVMAMGARHLGFSASRYAVLGSPVAPYPALHAIEKFMKASPATLNLCQDLYASEAGVTWAEMESGMAFEPEDKPLLAIFDEDDAEALVSQGELIQSIWPNTTLHITQGLGHRKLMWASEVVEQVLAFLKADV